MRDEHRFREKIELSLEGRHVRAIAFAAVLFLGAAFALGVLVGKRLASRAAAPAPLDDLAALDAEPPSPQKAPGSRGSLSAVTRPGTGESTRPGTSETTRPGASETTRPGTSTPARNGVGAGSDNARVREAVASPVPVPPPPDPDEKPSVPPEAPARPATAVRTVPAPPPTSTVSPAPRTAQVSPPQTGLLPAPPPDPGKFTVQVGATQDRMEAREMVARASKGGLHPYVMEARLAGRGLWYRVRVGAFADRARADQYRRDVERELRMPAVVMPAR